MKIAALCFPLTLALAGCAGLSPPSGEQLKALPLVVYPDKPPAGDFVYKLPAGRDIDMRMLVDGSALAGPVDQTLSARLNRDLYLHKRWASEDGQHWLRAADLVAVHLTVTLPSYETPVPGQMHLAIDRKQP